MISIDTIREYYNTDAVFVSEHAAFRFMQRGIKMRDIRAAVFNGEIIEQYPDDFPFPSCLIMGKDSMDRIIHVCLSDEGSSSRIITAYYPDPDRWSGDFKTRKEAVE